MSVIALKPNYTGNVRDAKDQFNGQQVLFVEWLAHPSICAPIAVMVEPTQKFDDFINTILGQSVFATHPDWSSIDWQQVEWTYEQQPLAHSSESTFESLGIGHKSYLKFATPGVSGRSGVC